MAAMMHKQAVKAHGHRGSSSSRGWGPARANMGLPNLHQGRGAVVRAQNDPDENLESMFSQELKRRGLDSIDDLGGWPSASERGGQATSTSKSPFQSATKTTPRASRAADTDGPGGDQRQRSIAMVNEGLEGLIPRATELLKLGGSVFLAFAPFILAISLLFGGIYVAFGDHFVHGGERPAAPHVYVDPNELLSEPTVDPYIPYQ